MRSWLLLLFMAVVSCAPKDGEYVFKVLTTNDIHGCYFDSLYVKDGVRNSMMSVSWYVDSIRTAAGRDNVILIDAGDFLQGENAAYYFNFIDTESEHVFARMAEYMGYDAVVAGNHDVEAGHAVYDRLVRQMRVPFLAANAIAEDGSAYFREYTLLRRRGMKIAVLGFTNPNIPGWLSPELWSGMTFSDYIPFVQHMVDRVIAKEDPDMVVVALHSGTGNGDGTQYENAGLDLFMSLRGVDLVIGAHDHRPVTFDADSICLINAGSRCSHIGVGTVSLNVKNGKVISRSSDAELIEVDKTRVDARMSGLFHEDYLKVKAFTCQEIGDLKSDLRTSDAYAGMSDYINLIHTLSLTASGAQVSFAAPLTFNGTIPAGKILYNDLFTIYPFENQIYVLKMTGKEIKDYLEYSYEGWINTCHCGSSNLLKIVQSPDPRTGQARWSFVGRPYNFDSAGGLVYDVDVTRPYGERISVKSFADGSHFADSVFYDVAMTSYRANGGGDILKAGAGIDTSAIEERIVKRGPEFRDILYDYLRTNGVIDPVVMGNAAVIGQWKFVPDSLVVLALSRDMELMFE